MGQGCCGGTEDAVGALRMLLGDRATQGDLKDAVGAWSDGTGMPVGGDSEDVVGDQG